MPEAGPVDGQLNLRPGEGIAVEEPAIVQRPTVSAQAAVQQEDTVGEGGEAVPGAATDRMVLIVLHDLRPDHGPHVEDVHVVHALAAIATPKDEDSTAETGSGMGGAGNGHIASRLRPLPLVARRIVAHQLVVPPAGIVLFAKKFVSAGGR